MKKIRDFLYKRFLPWETKELYLNELNALRSKVEQQNRELESLRAYLDGINHALRSQRRIVIKNEVGKNDES